MSRDEVIGVIRLGSENALNQHGRCPYYHLFDSPLARLPSQTRVRLLRARSKMIVGWRASSCTAERRADDTCSFPTAQARVPVRQNPKTIRARSQARAPSIPTRNWKQLLPQRSQRNAEEDRDIRR